MSARLLAPLPFAVEPVAALAEVAGLLLGFGVFGAGALVALAIIRAIGNS